MKNAKDSPSGDQAKSGSITVQTLAVTFPPDNPSTGESNVVVMMPMMDNGILCRASGSVSVPSGESLEGIYVKVVTGTTLPSDQDLYQNYDKRVLMSMAGPWNLNTQLKAWAGPGTTLVNNTFCAITITHSVVFVGGIPTYATHYRDRTNSPFKGKQVTSCPAAAPLAGPASAPVTVTAPVVPVVDPSHRYPTDRDGDWLLYQGLSAGLPGMGNVLMLDGQPLRARVAAFAAGNVLWQHSLEFPLGTVFRSGVVRRAVGELVPANSSFLLAGAPKNSLVVSQAAHSVPFKPFVHVLASECREHPDFVHLDPTEDIRVQVNFDMGENVRTGEFDLWVKVVTT